MIDTKAMAYVNMYGVLGALENMCQLDGEAQALLWESEGKTVTHRAWRKL